jgi:hypothetical protein
VESVRENRIEAVRIKRVAEQQDEQPAASSG